MHLSDLCTARGTDSAVFMSSFPLLALASPSANTPRTHTLTITIHKHIYSDRHIYIYMYICIYVVHIVLTLFPCRSMWRQIYMYIYTCVHLYVWIHMCRYKFKFRIQTWISKTKTRMGVVPWRRECIQKYSHLGSLSASDVKRFSCFCG